MTAEVAVMNKQAIALAADSAVTFRDEMGQKIFTSASKIFTLSKYQPVGMMVYGNASIMGTPWETVIKAYRDQLKQKAFETINNYADDFISFLTKEKLLFAEQEEERYVRSSIYSYFALIVKEIDEQLSQIIKSEGEQETEEVKKIISQIIQSHFDRWEGADFLSQVPSDFVDNLKEKYSKLMQEAKEHFFADISSVSSEQLTEIALNLFMKYPTGMFSSGTSGVVIAGFGTEDMFPILLSFSIDGKVCGFLKHKKNDDQSTKIDFENDATIIPFAQREMVATFMTGVEPSYQIAIEKDLQQLFAAYPQTLVDGIDKLSKQEKKELQLKLETISNEIFSDYVDGLNEHRNRFYVNPIMRVVQMLPKDELAAMAESLINLTSFKRKVSMEEETVGGPIDVAVISKGDGFIWIKRKHYFDPELNQQFFANYYREAKKDESETAADETS